MCAGVHVFLKGGVPSCVDITLTPDGCTAGTVAAGADVNFTITVDTSSPDCTNQELGDAPYVTVYAVGNVDSLTLYNQRVDSAVGVVKPPRTDNGQRRGLFYDYTYLDVVGGIGTATMTVQAGSGGPFVVGVSFIGADKFSGDVFQLAVFNCD